MAKFTTRRSKKFVLASLGAACLLMAGCGGGDDDTTSEPTAAPSPTPTPTPTPTPAPSGSASECFNIAWYTPGTTAVLDYAITGEATGTTRSNMTVGGGKSFNGQSGLIEFFQDQTTTYSAPATLASAGTVPTQSRFYFTENGSVVTEYGGTAVASATVAGISVSTTTTVTYTPAKINRRFTLASGASDTVSYTQGVTGSTNFGPIPSTSTAQTATIRFVGQETVTVPAGTFVACKFMDTINSDTTEQWFAKGSGAPIRSTSRTTEGQVVTLSMTSASRLNGAAIAP